MCNIFRYFHFFSILIALMKRPDNVIKRPGNARQCRRCDVTKVRCEVVCEGGKEGVKSYIDATTSKKSSLCRDKTSNEEGNIVYDLCFVKKLRSVKIFITQKHSEYNHWSLYSVQVHATYILGLISALVVCTKKSFVTRRRRQWLCHWNKCKRRVC